MMQLPKMVLLACAALLVATGYAYAQFFILPTDTPAGAYKKAYQRIQQDLQPNDMLFVHPPWREDVVSSLNKLTAKNRGPQITNTLPESAGEFGQLTVLADPTAPPLSKRLREMGLTRINSSDKSIHIFTLKGGKPSSDDTLDFINLLHQAKVTIKDKNGKSTSCRWSQNNRQFKCPNLPNWMYVGPYTMKSGKDEKRCIWSHPISKGEVQIRFPKPALKSNLIFEHAFSNNAARSSNKSPVTVTIKKDNETLTQLSRKRKPGFSRSSLLISEPASEHLDIIVQTEDDGAGHYCFNLFTQTGGALP